MVETLKKTLDTKLNAAFLRALNKHVNVCNLTPLTEGAGAQTWLFSVQESKEKFIARIAHEGEIFSEAISKNQEAQAQKAAFDAGVAVADVLLVFTAEDELGQGYIMPCIEGETRPKKLLLSDDFALARKNIVEQVAQAMASIHNIDVMPLRGHVLKEKKTSDQVNSLYQTFLSYNEALPIFHLAFRFLRTHCPQDERLTVVHGDFRNGNIMLNHQGLVAVLDWELAHIGNPLEDLGWFCVNSWRFAKPENPAGGFGSYAELLDAYTRASGQEVSKKELLYWELLGVVRWGVLCLYQAHVHLTGAERSVERVAIGRRVSECEIDIIELLEQLTIGLHG